MPKTLPSLRSRLLDEEEGEQLYLEGGAPEAPPRQRSGAPVAPVTELTKRRLLERPVEPVVSAKRNILGHLAGLGLSTINPYLGEQVSARIRYGPEYTRAVRQWERDIEALEPAAKAELEELRGTTYKTAVEESAAQREEARRTREAIAAAETERKAEADRARRAASARVIEERLTRQDAGLARPVLSPADDLTEEERQAGWYRFTAGQDEAGKPLVWIRPSRKVVAEEMQRREKMTKTAPAFVEALRGLMTRFGFSKEEAEGLVSEEMDTPAFSAVRSFLVEMLRERAAGRKQSEAENKELRKLQAAAQRDINRLVGEHSRVMRNIDAEYKEKWDALKRKRIEDVPELEREPPLNEVELLEDQARSLVKTYLTEKSQAEGNYASQLNNIFSMTPGYENKRYQPKEYTAAEMWPREIDMYKARSLSVAQDVPVGKAFYITGGLGDKQIWRKTGPEPWDVERVK